VKLIARIWRGATRSTDADGYAEYLGQTGMKEYQETPGNKAAYILRRKVGERTEFITLSFWDSIESVRAFAGTDVDQAVFYPDDDRYLVERDDTVTHYDLIE
jgi:heme-degrading monooxygenase HmoA